MATARVEFLTVVQTKFSTGPDNVINDVLASANVTTSSTAASSSPSPSKTNAVRISAIGGNVLVNPKAVAAESDGIRIADGNAVILNFGPNRTVSVIDSAV